jgi:peptidoglycan/LPS O-acetylase OafA/YrhL
MAHLLAARDALRPTALRSTLRPPRERPASSSQAAPSRLDWLDAMRGLAALCVVFDHVSYHVLLPVRHFLSHHLDLGQYGVYVFFLVSGYIIPASLERKGSVRGFWVGRAFRLYPPYLLVLAISLAGFAFGVVSVAGANRHWLIAALAWLLMMPNMMGGANIPNVTWTLSYEMVFYLLVAALFSLRAHRQSGWYALACGIAALALGGGLPMDALSQGAGNALRTNIVADAVIVGGVALALRGKQSAGGRHVRDGAKGGPGLLAIGGGCAAALAGLTLLTFNQSYPYPWTGYTILAFMFTGTLIYRAEQGDVGRGRAAVIAVTVLGLTLATGLWDGRQPHAWWAADWPRWRDQWITSLAGAALTFGLGLLVRRRRIPRVLPWLGVISYSVYLFHPLVLSGFEAAGLFGNHSLAGQVALLALFVVVVIGVSAASYYLLERPMQDLGRRLAKRWDRRAGQPAEGSRRRGPDEAAVPAAQHSLRPHQSARRG